MKNMAQIMYRKYAEKELTEKELSVVKAFGKSDFGDYDDVLWMWEIRESSGVGSKSFSGVCASLHKKGLIFSDTQGDKTMIGVALPDTYIIELTDKGKKVYKSITEKA